MSDKELTQLCKELSAQIVLAYLEALPQRQTTNKRVSIELSTLSRIKITAKFDKFLHTVCGQISANSATLYRLCHRKPEMSHSSISSSGTFTDDVAVCVLSTLMQEQPNLWSALCNRAILLKPKRPILRLGMTLLIVVTIKEVKQFTNRATQVLNLASPRSRKRQREDLQQHEELEERLPEKERTKGNAHTNTYKHQAAVINKLEAVNKNNREHLSSSLESSSSLSTTLLDEEQAEFVVTHYFARITSVQEQIRTPALISIRVHDKRQHSSLSEASGDTINHTSIFNTSMSNIGENTIEKCNSSFSNEKVDSLTIVNNSRSNDNFYLEPNEEQELVQNENDYYDYANAPRTAASNIPSQVVSSLLTVGLWSRSTNSWLQLIADVKRCKQISKLAKLSHLISNPLLLASHEWHNRKIQIEQNSLTHLINFNVFNEATLSCKPNSNEESFQSVPSMLQTTLSPNKQFVAKTCYITSKYAWARLLICALWQLMLQSIQINDCNITSQFCEDVQTLSARFIQQARKWNAETHCPVCDELQLERAPIHWSLIQEDRKELNRQLVPFMNESHSAEASVECPHTITLFHTEEEELQEEKELKQRESMPEKENISTYSLSKEYVRKKFADDNVSGTRFTNFDCDHSDAVLSNSHYTHLLWCNMCKCTTLKEFCSVLRKSCNAKTFPESLKEILSDEEEGEEESVTLADGITATGNDNDNDERERSEVECDQEITPNMRKLFVVALTHRLQAIVQLLEAATQVHYSMQVNNFMQRGEVHVNKEEQHLVNDCNYNNTKGKGVYLNDHNKLLLHNHGWILGDRSEFTFGQWINESIPLLYTLITREWLSNIDVFWCANMLCKLTCTNSKRCENVISTTNNSNNNNRFCEEQLRFTPTVPFLRCKDKIVECARCLAWFHHRCIAPPQDCFIDDKFFCHGCRLLLYKELQWQMKSQKEKSHESHEILSQDFVQCSAYHGFMP